METRHQDMSVLDIPGYLKNGMVVCECTYYAYDRRYARECGVCRGEPTPPRQNVSKNEKIPKGGRVEAEGLRLSHFHNLHPDLQGLINGNKGLGFQLKAAPKHPQPTINLFFSKRTRLRTVTLECNMNKLSHTGALELVTMFLNLRQSVKTRKEASALIEIMRAERNKLYE